MRDTLFEIARKRDALNQMHDKAKLAKEREPIVSPSSQSYDMEDRQMSTQSTDSLGQLLKEHITELQEKIESVKSNRKRLFDEIDEIQQERQSKDRQYESNIASLLDNPPQLNDWMKID
jgi:chromosome segregation ATPase